MEIWHGDKFFLERSYQAKVQRGRKGAGSLNFQKGAMEFAYGKLLTTESIQLKNNWTFHGWR